MTLGRGGRSGQHARMASPDPTVRSQELGHALRELRDRTRLTLAEAGERIDASPTKMCRLETGRCAVVVEDIAALLAVYRVTGARRSALLNLARESGSRGWWQRDPPSFEQRRQTLVALESRALTITNFEGMIVPGLLQTGEYTRALMIECGHVAQDQVEERMVARLHRHAVLRRRNPPELVAIIDDLALRRVIGGPDVHRRQLDQLGELARLPNITIRVVPNNDRANAGVNGAFAVLRRPDAPPVVFLENLTSSLFLEDPHEIQRYEFATRELLRDALDAAESAKHIAALARCLDEKEHAAHDDLPGQPALAQEFPQREPGELR